MSNALVTLEPIPALERHRIRSLPVVVLFPHSRCNCRCVMCDIWRIRRVREITAADLEKHVRSFRALGVRWVVLSGGEPQLHSDLAGLCAVLRAEGIRITLLTAGLLLERQATWLPKRVDEIIVSLDGPADVHNRIRGIPGAFERLAHGIRAIRAHQARFPIAARSTVQKGNAHCLRATARSARELCLDSISFLATDLTSTAFNRPDGWSVERQEAVRLTPEEVDRLGAEMEILISEFAVEIASGFIVESPPKLRQIVRHFRAHLGQIPPESPSCNAPWVSAVIESDGAVRPCFFHPPYGSFHEGTLEENLNSETALTFRRDLDIPRNPICQQCVCSLNLPLAGLPGAV